MIPFIIPSAVWNRNKLRDNDKFWTLLVAKKEKTSEPISSVGASAQTSLSAISLLHQNFQPQRNLF